MAHAPRNARRRRSEIDSCAPSRDQENAVLQQPFCGLDSAMRAQANPTKLTKLTHAPPSPLPLAGGDEPRSGEGVGPCTAPARRIPTHPTTPRFKTKHVGKSARFPLRHCEHSRTFARAAPPSRARVGVDFVDFRGFRAEPMFTNRSAAPKPCACLTSVAPRPAISSASGAACAWSAAPASRPIR
jgi:hypothetical protein